MRVRAAGVGDVESMMAMERAAETAPHWAEAVYAGLMEGGGRERGVWVAEDVGEIVGFGVVGEVAGVAEVENLVVRAEVQRRGVGRALGEAMVGWARERGAEAVEMEVRESNVGARALYGVMGFREVGLRRGYYGDGEDAVLLWLRL